MRLHWKVKHSGRKFTIIFTSTGPALSSLCEEIEAECKILPRHGHTPLLYLFPALGKKVNVSLFLIN
jgi:hypothetical protein